jgi:hypothetical protein
VAGASLTRYAGLPLIPLGAALVLLLPEKRLKQRLLDVALWGALSSAPLTLWTMRNYLLAGNATSRSLDFHPITASNMEAGVASLSRWLLPVSMAPGWVQPCAAVMIILTPMVLMGILGHRFRLDEAPLDFREHFSLPLVLYGFLTAYLAFVVLSISFVDGATYLSEARFLAPVHCCWLVMMTCLVHRLVENGCKRGRAAAMVGLALMLAFAGSYVGRGMVRLAGWDNERMDMGSRRWKGSPIVQQIGKLGPEVPLYTNIPDKLSYLTGRRAEPIPPRLYSTSRRENVNYEEGLAGLRERMRKSCGVLVYFSVSSRWSPSEDELLREIPGLRPILQDREGNVYRLSADRCREGEG